MRFLRNFLASLLALFVFSIAMMIIFSMIISAVSEKDVVEVKEKSVLHLKLDKLIREFEYDDPLSDLPIALAPSSYGLIQIKEALGKAKDDDNIRGIFLETPMLFASGFSTIEEIRSSLEEFRSSGKFIVAYSEYYSEGAYYLSSIADDVCMHPEGDIEFNGLSVEIMYFKGLFEKLDIKPQVFKVGDFKSAVEPFTNEEMSPENELQLKVLLESIYSNMLTRVGEARNISNEELRNISNKMMVRNPQDAQRLQLIDHLYYYDQAYDLMKEKLQIEEDDEINFITYKKYRKSYSNYISSKNEVAVIVANGEIINGEGDNNTVGGEKFSKEIRSARLDDDIKAIVLRINSPGGSFIASDVMWREIKLAAEVKPVIASMSDLAASGGYYMAMACDTIIAMPNTITGSIGIFGMIPDMSGFLDNKLGITFDEVKTGEISNLYTVTRPLTEREKQIIQTDVEAGYETFISKAAEGRDISIEQIKNVASGRVWTGEQALERNLVDMLGNFDLAIQIAAEKAGVQDDFKIRYYPKVKTVLEQLLEGMESSAKTYYLQQELGNNHLYYKKAKEILDRQGVMSRMDFDLIIK